MKRDSELAQQIQLALPLAAQQLGFQLMGTVDALMLGRYDEGALAAAGVGNNLLFAITSIGMGIVLGLDTVIPQAIGAKRPDDARRYLAGGLRLAILVGLLGTLAILASPLVLHLTDIEDEVRRDAELYIYLRSIGVVPFLLSIALRGYLAARMVTRPLVVAVVAANVVNVGLNYALIFGVDALGIPSLGVIGAGIATLAAQLVIVGTYFVSLRTLREGPLPTSTRADLAHILHFGLPVGGQLFAEVAIFGVATVMAADLGTHAAAAHAIALNLSSFTFSLTVGIGTATSVRVGHAVGAGDLALARRRGLLGLGIGLAVMTAFALVFVAVPGPIAHAFSDEPDVAVLTISLLQVAAVFQLSDGAQAIAAGALRGLGHTRVTLVGNLIGHYGVGLAVSLALGFGAGLGVVGLWWGLSAGLTATAFILVVRFAMATRTVGVAMTKRPISP